MARRRAIVACQATFEFVDGYRRPHTVTVTGRGLSQRTAVAGAKRKAVADADVNETFHRTLAVTCAPRRR